MPRFSDRCADCAPLPESASRRDKSGDLPKQPRRSQQPDVHVFFFVATPEIGMPECARPVKPARALEAATRFDERPDVANHPDANRSEVFVLWLSNALALSRERRLNDPAIYPDATAPLDGCSAC